jgi:hypothetical protein
MIFTTKSTIKSLKKIENLNFLDKKLKNMEFIMSVFKGESNLLTPDDYSILENPILIKMYRDNFKNDGDFQDVMNYMIVLLRNNCN